VVASDPAANAVLSSPVEQAKQSEATELSVARATNKVAALQTYLTRYPDTPNRQEIEEQIARLKRSDFKEWTLFEFANSKLPYYVQLSSIVRFKDRAAIFLRYLVDPDIARKVFLTGKEIPDARFVEDVNVYDCKELRTAISEETVFASDGRLLFHYKYADPRYLNLAVGTNFAPNTSLGSSLQRVACNDDVSTPLLTKEQLAKMEFKLISPTLNGEGEVFFEELPELSTENQKEAIVILRFFSDQATAVPPTAILDAPPHHRIEVDRVDVQCRERRISANRSEYYSASLDLNFLQAPASLANRNWIELKPEIVSPLSTLHGILCESKESYK
jgi:hypothetical protein